MRKFFLFLFCFSFIFLFSEELDLGDIVIKGKTILISDSLETSHRLSDYDALDKLNEISFQSAYSKIKFFEPDKENIGDRGYLYFNLGEYFFTKVRAKLLSPQTTLVDIALNIDYFNLEEGWDYSFGEVSWSPRKDAHYLHSTVYNSILNWDDGFRSRELKGINLAYKLSDFVLSDKAILNKLEMNISYNLYDYKCDMPADGGVDTSISDDEIALSLSAAGEIDDLIFSFKTAYIKNHTVGEIAVGRKKVFISEHYVCDNLALNFFYEKAASTTFVYPMISFYRKLQISPKLYLSLENEPEIIYSSFGEYFIDNLYNINFASARELDKKFINFTSSILYNSFLPMTFSYNISEHYGYNFIENGLVLDREEFQLWEAKISAELSYVYGNFQVIQSYAYYPKQENLHFLTNWQAVTNLSFIESQWRIALDLDYLDRNIDATLNGYLPESMFIVSISQSYDIKPNFQVQAKVFNILNSDARKYSFQPEAATSFRFDLGMKYTF